MALYCSTPFEYERDLCATEPGRIIAVAAVRTDAGVLSDPTTLATWNTDVTNGRVIIINPVSGAKPKSTAVNVEGIGRVSQKLVNRDHTASYTHFDIVGNEDFYNGLNNSVDHYFWFYTAGQKLFTTSAVGNWDGDFEILEGLNTVIQWRVDVGWSERNIPIGYDASGLISLFEVTE